MVLAEITDDGRALAHEATAALNRADFALSGFTADQAAELTSVLRAVRVSAGEVHIGR